MPRGHTLVRTACSCEYHSVTKPCRSKTLFPSYPIEDKSWEMESVGWLSNFDFVFLLFCWFWNRFSPSIPGWLAWDSLFSPVLPQPCASPSSASLPRLCFQNINKQYYTWLKWLFLFQTSNSSGSAVLCYNFPISICSLNTWVDTRL